MNLDEIIRGRRSVRLYSDRPIERKKLESVIEAANWAPSASNKQLWRFIVIEKDTLKQTLFNLGMTHILLSPVSILVLYGDPMPNPFYPDNIESASAAIQNLLLKAYELGLGTCWVNRLPSEHKIRKVFGFPWYYKVVALINIGYQNPMVKLKQKKRKYSKNEILFFNEFKQIEKIIPPSRIKIHYTYWRKRIKRLIKGMGMDFGCRGLIRPPNGWPGLKSITWEGPLNRRSLKRK